jgi:hypothetical protein
MGYRHHPPSLGPSHAHPPLRPPSSSAWALNCPDTVSPLRAWVHVPSAVPLPIFTDLCNCVWALRPLHGHTRKPSLNVYTLLHDTFLSFLNSLYLIIFLRSVGKRPLGLR